MKDAETEEEVGEERISVSLLRETSGLSHELGPLPQSLSARFFLFKRVSPRGLESAPPSPFSPSKLKVRKSKETASRKVLQVAHKVHSPSPFTPSGCLRSTHRPEGYRPEGYRKPRNRIS